MLLIPSIAFSQKYVELYNAGKYEKAIDQAEKAIDKNSKDLNAYLTKAMCNLHLYLDPVTQPAHQAGVLSAVNTLELIVKKDKDESFQQQHQPEIDSILKAGGDMATKYFEKGDVSRADKLLADLITLQPRPEYYFLAGRIAQQADNDDLAIHYYNTASAKIYKDSKAGKPVSEDFIPMFVALANAIGNQGDLKSAFVVYDRAFELFPSESLSDSCYYFLSALAEKHAYANDNIRIDQLIQYLDTIPAPVAKDSRFYALKWDCIFTRYYNMQGYYIAANIREANSYLTQWACKDQFTAAADTLLSAMLRNTYLKMNVYEIAVSRDPDMLQDYLTMKSCLNNGNMQQAEASYFDKIVYALEIKDFTFAGKLIYNLSSIKAYATQSKAFEKQLFTGLQQLSFDELSQIDLYALSLMFPGNTVGKKLQKDESIRQITALIDKGDFTNAGIKVRAQMRLDPKDMTVRTLYKTWVIKDYVTTYYNSATYSDLSVWNGNISKCDPGKLPDSIHNKVLMRLNYYRRLVGIPDNCVFDKELNKKCQAAALMMTANHDLSHGPPPDWSCYSPEGATGAGNSNLSLGYGGAEALSGQVEDDGGNNGAVGHRRWILNPFRKVYGHGSTDDAMALWALGGNDADQPKEIREQYMDTYVAWPPEWYSPAPLLPARWSLGMYHADFSEAKVQMFQGNNEIGLEVLPLEYGYGLSTIVWEPGINMYGAKGDQTYKVVVSHIGIDSTWDEATQSYKKEYVDHTYYVIAVQMQ